MLVLSRKKDEKIVIGDNITIMVIDIRGDKVRLGIDAPREVTVHRQEVYEAIQRENMQDEQNKSKSGVEEKVKEDVTSKPSVGGKPSDPKTYHNILSSSPNLLNYDVGLRLGGSYRSMNRRELIVYRL